MTGDTGIQEQVQVQGQAHGGAIVSTLSIVGDELMETIRNAHLALEDCVDGRGGSAALLRAGELLRQVRGALRITETYGAALLAEEMELGCKYLASLQAGKGRDDGLDALTRAMVQLPVYIERLLGGGRDIALVLLPMLNDLRAARGEPLLSEGTLLLLNLSPNQMQRSSGRREGSGEDPVMLATRLRPKFQLALLGWIKGGNTQQHLEALANVAARFEKAATRDDMHQLWWVAGAVLESLQEGGLDTSVALKRLLGQADRQIKHLIDDGVAAFDTHPADDLLNNLLYYVARSSTAGKRISDVRAAFDLSELLPGDEQVERARESLSAPSVRLMKTVAAAIKEDLGRVKDVLDIFVRTGMNKSSELVPQLELLKKISDTLGVLGLGELRGDIEGEIDQLKSVVERGGAENDQVILDIASTLLRVEDRLDQQLLRLIAPKQHVAVDQALELPPEEAADYQQVAESVMRECIINLARIKEAVGQSLESQVPSQALDSVPSLIRGIKAGLMLLDKTRAMEVVDRVGDLIALTIPNGGTARLSQAETDRLADAIVSIEYYMETVKAGRSEPWYMLDNAEACLTVLRDVEHRLAQEEEMEPQVAQAEETAAEQTAAASPVEMQATQVIPLPVVAQDAEHIDPELLELFIEEAKEEVASIKRKLPAWQEAPDDLEMLITVRRSFHTLKGSGRMVGAERIGEYCWSVESLLNRLINRTLVCTPPMVEFIVAAAAAVPELVEQLEVGTEPAADIGLLMARARAFTEGDPNAAVMTLPTGVEQSAEPADSALEMDPVLLDIFAKETAGHLQVITDYLAACEEQQPPFDITDQLHRACHTLHGSANMANVERGVAVTGAINRLVRRVYDFKVGLDHHGITLLREAAEAVRTIVADINQPDRVRADYRSLIEQLGELSSSMQPEHTIAEEPRAGVVETLRRPVEQTAEEADDEALAESAEYDAEIAAIFTEESAELLEMADKALIEWSQNRNARQPIEELKRYLHTLKGGARMAGITAMGDFSHELETLLISLDERRVKPTPAIDELLQHSVDELHRMRDTVIAGKAVAATADLVERIQQANAGLEVAEDVSRAAVETETEPAETTRFTIEPEEPVSMVIVDTPFADEQEKAAAQQDASGAALAPPEAQVESELEGEAESEIEADLEGEAVAGAEMEAGLETEELPEAELEAGLEAEELPEAELEAGLEAEELPEAESGAGLEAGLEDEAEPEPEPDREPEFIEPSARPVSLKAVRPEQRQEMARIDADLLEDLLNAAGEISIYHSRLSQQVSSFEFHVEELEQTISRLREQLRKLEIETEAQIMHGHHDTLVTRDFDPLEMDRYSNIQQLSRALSESSNDLSSLKDLLQSVTTEAEGLLVQQSRVTAELQDGLMRTRMVPFERHVPRLTRLVRQIAKEAGISAELAVEGASGELDRQVLDKMLPPLEHMLRNAIVHGIESPEERQAAGKPAAGRITIRLHREGAEMVVDIADDGGGLDVEAIRRKAYELDMLKPDAKVSDEEIMSLILTPGFSTASAVTQSAGRGVGMDVVANEVKKLGGSLRISSVTGQGTNFTVRLPFTLAITQALIVRTGDEVYALPLPSVNGVVRIPRAELETLLSQPEPSYEYGEQTYKFRHLGMYLGGQAAQLPENDAFVPVILVRAGEYSAALLTDEMLASREIVVKSVGPQLASIRGISGATILGDGRIVLILDVVALVRTGAPVVELKSAKPAPADDRPVALVVDDSITVRRVTERFLQRNGVRVVTAKDGLDAISVLSDTKPDIIILDIEMPRMDGYEFASHVRNDEQVADVPIIMVTSRVGDKHRAKAIELGVNDYLGKPYQDSQMLAAVERLLDERGIKLS
jgi:chemosensory pili system protein ChpA (sensor histidine kinase/response regulator)